MEIIISDDFQKRIRTFHLHSMVQLLRGEINVESKEGESAGFIVTLPYLEVEEMDLDEQADEEVPVAQPVVSAVAAEHWEYR